jgi:transposase
MVFYPESAVERAMKIQEVILRAMAKRITWCQAAEIIGISDRQMRRWYQRYQEFGYGGLFDRRRGRPSPKRVAVETVERMLGLYRDRYFDLNVQHFCEKLREEHSLSLSYTWVKTALQGAGLVRKGRRRGAHRRRRWRRPLPGMLVHLDGSRHRWFQDDRWYTTCWWCSTTRPVRSTTPNWSRKNRRAPCWRHCAKPSSTRESSAHSTAISPTRNPVPANRA